MVRFFEEANAVVWSEGGEVVFADETDNGFGGLGAAADSAGAVGKSDDEAIVRGKRLDAVLRVGIPGNADDIWSSRRHGADLNRTGEL